MSLNCVRTVDTIENALLIFDNNLIDSMKIQFRKEVLVLRRDS